MGHKERMERRRYVMERRYPRYHVTIIRGEELISGTRSNDLEAQIAKAKAKAPAYVIDNWARPTREVVFVAIKEGQAEADAYMTKY